MNIRKKERCTSRARPVKNIGILPTPGLVELLNDRLVRGVQFLCWTQEGATQPVIKLCPQDTRRESKTLRVAVLHLKSPAEDHSKPQRGLSRNYKL